jgi:hypothetical protein
VEIDTLSLFAGTRQRRTLFGIGVQVHGEEESYLGLVCNKDNVSAIEAGWNQQHYQEFNLPPWRF